MLAESTVVHRWLRIRVGHSETLAHIIDDKTGKSNWEEYWTAGAEEEGDIDNVDYEGQAVVDMEQGSRVNSLIFHDRLSMSFLSIARAERSLVNHTLNVPD